MPAASQAFVIGMYGVSFKSLHTSSYFSRSPVVLRFVFSVTIGHTLPYLSDIIVRIVQIGHFFQKIMLCMADNRIAEELKTFRAKKRFTQSELAEMLGVGRGTYKNWELALNFPPASIVTKLRNLGMGSDVGKPLIPASQLLIPVPFIGMVSCSSPANWTDPFESEVFEMVPPEMGDARGRFACKVESDSMMPLLHPEDVCVFQGHPLPRINRICLYRTDEGLATIKQVKHDGATFILHALNRTIPDVPVTGGTCFGYLVGIIRMIGNRKQTDFDPDGIIP